MARLDGVRLLVTRPAGQADATAAEFRALGAVVGIWPALVIAPPADWGEVDAGINRLRDGAYDWAAFTSANAVEAVASRGVTAGDFGGARLAAVGRATAAAMSRAGWPVHLVPATATATVLAAELRGLGARRVLFPRAAEGKESLLAELPGCEGLVVYRQVANADTSGEAWVRLQRGEIDCVTLWSANAARAFGSCCDAGVLELVRSGAVRFAAISAHTAAALVPLGGRVAVAAGPGVAEFAAAVAEVLAAT